MTLVRGLRQAEMRLARLEIGQMIAEALNFAAQNLEAKVVDALSQSPGQDHGAPWLRTGALRASISSEVDGNVAIVGSSSDVAVDQELGTRTVQPRPFLASSAAGAADGLTESIALTLASHLSDR